MNREGAKKKFEEMTGEKVNEEKDFIKKGKFGSYVDIDLVCEEIKSNYNFVTIFGKQSEEIWVYNNGIYKLEGRAVILSLAEELLKEWAKTKVVNEILNKIKRQTELNREKFDDTPKELLPLENGVLNFKTGEFSQYSPNYYFKTKIDIKYNQDEECPNWLNFIEQTFYPEDIPVIQEWWGFCLYRDYFIKKGLIGVGVGDTGKSVFQNVMLKFFGSKNISGLNLQKLTKDNNFSKSSLYGKYVNLYDDMSANDINEAGGFKMVTGRSPITAEYKFGDEFQFVNFAKMTFCCNRVPPIKDTDDNAYYDRWLVIQFDNVVPKEDQDKFLIEKLTTPKELSGILNWALVGLKRLLENGCFSYKKDIEQIKAFMDRNSYPLAEFVQDCLVEEKDSKITKEEMFEVYTEWAKQKKKSRETIERLGRNLPRYATYIIPSSNGKQRYWDNVKINDTYDTILKNIRGQGYIYNNYLGIDKISKKVSLVSQESLDEFNDKDTNWEDDLFK